MLFTVQNDAYQTQLQKLKNEVRECMYRVKTQTEETAKKEKLNILKAKEESRSMKESSVLDVVDDEPSERDRLVLQVKKYVLIIRA